jgi:cell division protein FtsI (penicillin-binding protein 3)
MENIWLEDSIILKYRYGSGGLRKLQNNPSKFVNHVNSYGLNKKLNMDFEGEGRPVIPQKRQNWSNISLPWMAFGYGVSVTPMQTLAFYNAVANKYW